MNKQTEYMSFKEVPNPSGKTKIVSVESVKHGFPLGIIKWHGAWRQYVFFPAEETLFNGDCLKDIIGVLAELMEERKPRCDNCKKHGNVLECPHFTNKATLWKFDGNSTAHCKEYVRVDD